MGKIKIGLIELKDHPVFLDSLLNIFDTKMCEISVYLSYSFKKNLANKKKLKEDIEFIIQKKNEKLVDFIKINKSKINNNDIVIFLTPELNILSKIDIDTKLIVNIHNLNTWINNNKINLTEVYENISSEIKFINLPSKVYEFKMIRNLFKVIKILKYIYTEYFNKSKRNKIIKKIDSINLLHPNMNNMISDKSSKNIINLPFRFPKNINESAECINESYLCIGVMGTVEQQRRDYIGLLKYLINNNQKIDFRLKFIFLGTFKKAKKFKKMVLKLIDNIKNENIDFELFLDINFIEQELFDKKMKDIDIILAPIHRYKYNILYKEEYGVSKATGSDFDAFYYNKPIIMPNFYNPINYLEDFYSFYRNYKELLNLLKFYSNKDNLKNKYKVMNSVYDINFKEEYYKQLKSLLNF